MFGQTQASYVIVVKSVNMVLTERLCVKWAGYLYVLFGFVLLFFFFLQILVVL